MYKRCLVCTWQYLVRSRYFLKMNEQRKLRRYQEVPNLIQKKKLASSFAKTYMCYF